MNSSYTDAGPTADPDVGVMTATMDSFEPQAMEEAVSRSTVEHLQLTRGRFLGQLMHAQFTSSILDWGSYNLPLLATACMPADRITLGFILASDGESMMNAKRFTAPTAALFTEGTELHYRMAENTQWMALQVERDLLERIGLSVQQGFAGPVANAARENPQRNQHLRDALAMLWNLSSCRPDPGIPDPAGCMKQLEAHLMDLMASECASAHQGAAPESQHRPEAIRLVREATDYIHDHMAEPLRIAALCCELDCTLKSLERAFQRIHGMTPKQFLTLARLNKARQLLLDRRGRYGVTYVATVCGIQHLGRFSQTYSSWFGERPSETLSRRLLSGKAN
jgi:AraC family transcriptional regulator, ethanolamine operon transcriptional activator